MVAVTPPRTAAVGAFFGTPDSARKVPGMSGQALHRDEMAALNRFALPAAVLPLTPTNCSFHKKQRDEPDVQAVWSAVHRPPAGAPSARQSAADLAAMPKGNVLKSPRRTAALGETLHHATPWEQPTNFTLSTPYAMATNESRFADAQADKAALAAVAFTAGLATAGPNAGISTNKMNTLQELPSMRKPMMNNGRY